MNRSEFIRFTAKKYGCDQKTTKAWVMAVIEAMGEVLSSGEDLMLTQFGVFEQQTVKPKVGRNKYTGERIEIPAHRKVRFDLCERLDAALNNEDASTSKNDHTAETPAEHQ